MTQHAIQMVGLASAQPQFSLGSRQDLLGQNEVKKSDIYNIMLYIYKYIIYIIYYIYIILYI